MPTGSDKHGPMQDDDLKQAAEDLERSGREPRTDAAREQEAPGEDQPEPDAAPEGTLTGGTPIGMGPTDVQWRSELARFLEHGAFPGAREALQESAQANNASDQVVELLNLLPAGREFQNVQEVWEALGGDVESRRH